MNARTWLVVAMVIALAGVALVPHVAAAADTAPAGVVDGKGRGGPGVDPGTSPMPGNGHGARQGMGRDASLIAVAAEVLGMDRWELVAELRGGKTIADVAAERGVDLQDIVDAFLAKKSEWLQGQVDAGRITPEQADEILARAAEHVVEQLSTVFEPTPRGRAGRGGGSGPGGCLP